MTLKTLLTLSALLVAVPAIAQDQTRQQTRDPSTHVDGATPTQDRTRTDPRRHPPGVPGHGPGAQPLDERSGAGKGSGSGGGNGGGSGSGYRGGK